MITIVKVAVKLASLALLATLAVAAPATTASAQTDSGTCAVRVSTVTIGSEAWQTRVTNCATYERVQVYKITTINRVPYRVTQLVADVRTPTGGYFPRVVGR